ncbi:MAG: hypothetical protein KDB10_02355 [Acidimicrobiales bacterium]|nr:hypothetical protein [Acidimicrobiales bacterium]
MSPAGRRALAAILAVGALVALGACRGGEDAVDDGAHPAADVGGGTVDTSVDGDATLIPPSNATSPTSGPPNTDPLAAAAAPSPSTCEGRTPGPANAAADLEVRVQLGETLEPGRVRWALTVANRGDEAVVLAYPTSQDGDVVLRDGRGEAYRWSAERAFAQQLRCQVIGAAQEYRIELGGVPLDVAPGDYTLVATVAADPAPEPARVPVTVDES